MWNGDWEGETKKTQTVLDGVMLVNELCIHVKFITRGHIQYTADLGRKVPCVTGLGNVGTHCVLGQICSTCINWFTDPLTINVNKVEKH
jgi:hypothetical protein